MREKIIWAVAAASVVTIIYFSGDGFYRYPCQSPELFDAVECNPPLCLRTRNCASDLTGVSE
jgi:hypothetical protein